LAHAEQGLDVITSLAQADSYTVAMAKVHVGRALLAQRQAARALSTLEEARETLRVARGPQHPQTLDVEAHMAMATAWLGRPGPARELIDKVLEPLRSAPVRTRYQALHFAGAIHRLQQEGETAKALQEQALDVLPELPMNQRRRRAARVELALLALDRGDVPAASRWLESGDAAGLPDTAGNPDEASLLLAWARLELARGRADRAIEPMNSIDRFWRERGPDSRWSGEAAYWLARCNAALNHPAEARAALRRAAEVLGRSSLPSDQHLAQLAQRG
jgi:tetratricopeptide (TPR) repeat protein